jgi:hypothetical protein
MASSLPGFGDMVRGHGEADLMFRRADVMAREAVERRQNHGLVDAVHRFTSGVGPTSTNDRPVFMLIRAIASWDNEVLRFLQLCQAVDAEPVIVTMLGDRFTSLNMDKYRRARMTFWWQNRTRVLRAGDMRAADGRSMSELRTRRGLPLAQYHHALLNSQQHVRTVDLSDWLRPGGRSDYVHFFALCMVGAVLVEAIDEDPLERQFVRERMLPAWHRASSLFGVAPLVTCHYTPAENRDDYWWGYPGEAFATAADLLYTQAA